MAAVFWWDRRAGDGANGDPDKVVKGLKDEKSGRKSKTLYGFGPGHDAENVVVFQDYCLYIDGTTGDIQKALSADMSRNLKAILVVDDDMDIRYVRRDAGSVITPKTKTVVGIAGTTHYWGDDTHSWAPITRNPIDASGRGQVTQGRQTWNARLASVLLSDLHAMVEVGRDVDAWIK